ncbi:MAG: ATP-dependent Clp protease ATP-binding subunit ClpC, partial [Myxococcota bacterium]
LNGDFPDELKRTLSDDPRVDLLDEAIYTSRPAPLVLVGPPGAGRTTLLHEAIARHLDHHRQKQTDIDRIQRVWHLDPTRVVSGMSTIGAWQRRTEAILAHLQERLKKRFHIRRADALFIDNPVALCRVGRSAGGDLTLSTVLRPYVEQRALPIVMEATAEQWQRLEELDRPFADLFRVVRVQPPPRDKALRILIRRREQLEASTGSWIARGALRRIAELEERYPSSRAAPGSLVERLERLVDQVTDSKVTVERVEEIFLRRSGMRPEMLDPTRPLPAAALQAQIARRLIGQPEAVSALSDVIHTTRAGVSAPGRPAASLLFVGPTGVGKTEAAKVLVQTLYALDESMLRLDMNEYVDADAARRLIGDASRPEGQLTGRIRHRPFCVLLLDEIEKAHPSVHDLLLQVLDEGRLTDSLGRVSDFSQAIVVLTSNVGAREVGKQAGFGRGASGQAATYRGALRRSFRPEFLNRIDQVVVFGSLSPADIQEIARLQLARLLLREGLLRRTVLLELTPAVLAHVAHLGFDAQMGARALKRALEQELVAPIADCLVSIPIEQPTTLHIDVADGALVLTDAPLPMAAELSRPLLSEALAGLEEDGELEWALSHVREILEALNSRSELALAAVSSPDGAHVPEEMMLLSELRTLRSQLDTSLAEVEDLPPLSHSVLSGSNWRRNPRISQKRLRKPYWRCSTGSTGQEEAAHDQTRAMLLDLIAESPAQHSKPTVLSQWQLIDTLQRGQALLREGPPGAAVYLRNLTAAAEGAWEMFADLLESWRSLLKDRDIALTVHCVDGRGRIIAEPEEPADRIWELRGPGAVDILAPEAGIHLFYPDDEPPQALQLQLAPLGEGPPPLAALLTDWTVPTSESKPSAIRQYCPPDQTSDRGSVSDLRTGMVVSYSDFRRWHREWIHHGMPDELRLEVLP